MSEWDATLAGRAAVMRGGLDFARLSGLEVGPLSHPIVRREDGPVTYVDCTDADSLRRTYAGSAHVNVSDIVEVDAIWGERTLGECLGGRTVDYVMASHVAEHVPDLVTWLAEVREVLNPGGELRLALPDGRFSSDALRDGTRLSDLLTAWLLRARRPQVRDVLDFRLWTSSRVDGWGLVAGTAGLDGAQPDHSFEVAVEAATRVRDDPAFYSDVHCLVASAVTFATLMEQLAVRGLLRLACARMVDTALPLLEFYAFMVPCDDAGAVAGSWREARATLGEWPVARPEATSAAEVELVRLRSSRSWRWTAPLRRATSMLRGRSEAG